MILTIMNIHYKSFRPIGFWQVFKNKFSLVLTPPPHLKETLSFIWTSLKALPSRMLCSKLGWNWPSGSVEEDKNVKRLRRRQQKRRRSQRQRQTTDKSWSEKLTWAFNSSELKTLSMHFRCCVVSIVSNLVPVAVIQFLTYWSHTALGLKEYCFVV